MDCAFMEFIEFMLIVEIMRYQMFLCKRDEVIIEINSI
jgi:hypothetical protein